MASLATSVRQLLAPLPGTLQQSIPYSSVEPEPSTMTSSHRASPSSSAGIWTGSLTDLRHAVRLLWKAKGFTATTLLTLGLGIGATTAIFSTVYSLMLKPLPYQEPERIVELELVRDEGRFEPHAGQRAVLPRLFEERELLRKPRAVGVFTVW